jgi:hypothetical protein
MGPAERQAGLAATGRCRPGRPGSRRAVRADPAPAAAGGADLRLPPAGCWPGQHRPPAAQALPGELPRPGRAGPGPGKASHRRPRSRQSRPSPADRRRQETSPAAHRPSSQAHGPRLTARGQAGLPGTSRKALLPRPYCRQVRAASPARMPSRLQAARPVPGPGRAESARCGMSGISAGHGPGPTVAGTGRPGGKGQSPVVPGEGFKGRQEVDPAWPPVRTRRVACEGALWRRRSEIHPLSVDRSRLSLDPPVI